MSSSVANPGLYYAGESEPLVHKKPQTSRNAPGNEELTRCETCCGGLFQLIFYGACFLSGQLMIDFNSVADGGRARGNAEDDERQAGRPGRQDEHYYIETRCKVSKIFFCAAGAPLAILFFCLNIGAIGFNLYAIFFQCPFPYCAYVAGPFQIHDRNITITTGNISAQVGLTKEYIDMQKIVITMATLSGSLSYLIMLYILGTHYSVFRSKYHYLKSRLRDRINDHISSYTRRVGQFERDEGPLLNPFPFYQASRETKGPEYKKTVLHAQQMCCFYLIFILSVLLFGANVVVLFIIVNKDNGIPKNFTHPKKTDEIHRLIDYFGISAILGTHYCAIISCFIFSKIAYAVTIECSAMMKQFQNILIANEDTMLTQLHIADETFQKLSTESMRPFRFWFTVHWFLYAVTAFTALAYLAETITERLYGALRDCDETCNLTIVFIFLFTLVHIVLFLYPCFRAASILDARNSLIKRFCNKNFDNFSGEQKLVFVKYMKQRKCGFILSIFCTRIEFGFNIAYISIFLGLLGIVIRFALF